MPSEKEGLSLGLIDAYSSLKQASSWIIMALFPLKKQPWFLEEVRYQRISHVRSHENLWITQLLGSSRQEIDRL